MCTMSMVYDHFRDQFPHYDQWPFTPKTVTTGGTTPTIAEVADTISQFNSAKELAARLDAVMKQKDCLDADKAKLQERVDRLEKIIDALMAKP